MVKEPSTFDPCSISSWKEAKACLKGLWPLEFWWVSTNRSSRERLARGVQGSLVTGRVGITRDHRPAERRREGEGGERERGSEVGEGEGGTRGRREGGR